MEVRMGRIGASATPEATSRAFAQAIGARDPEAACAFLAADGCLLTPDGTEVRGKAQVREVLAQLTGIHTLIRIEMGRVMIAGSVAIVSQDWTLSSKGSEHEPYDRSFSALLVLEQGEQGWKVMVAAPWGM
ncbi:MAG TPA: DUF4440 domain-containing protein [Solirubrobacterales bacterium]|jgi:ketosteroid isomerase-like protein|nr:DUF4440 domain-containing protein [Solirubrobacterales bacterium]